MTTHKKTRKGPMPKLTKRQIQRIRERWSKRESGSGLARDYGVDLATISRVVNHLGAYTE